jgi:hypothetical protein
MSKTTLTLSDPMAKTLKVYSAQTKSSLHAQSKVVEEALREFFEKRDVKIGEHGILKGSKPLKKSIFIKYYCC